MTIEELFKKYASFYYNDFVHNPNWTEKQEDEYREENMQWCIDQVVSLTAQQAKREVLEEMRKYIEKNSFLTSSGDKMNTADLAYFLSTLD